MVIYKIFASGAVSDMSTNSSVQGLEYNCVEDKNYRVNCNKKFIIPPTFVEIKAPWTEN